jgi:hypothetical protein
MELMYGFEKGEDVNRKMSEYIDKLFSIALTMSIEERNNHCHILIENYFETVGYIPNSKHLSQLAAVIDLDCTVNPNKYKNKGDEFPVLTKKQMRRRKYREVEYIDEYKEKGTGNPRN